MISFNIDVDPIVALWIALCLIGLPFALSLLYATWQEDKLRREIEAERGLSSTPLGLYLRHAMIWAFGGVVFLTWGLVIGIAAATVSPYVAPILRYGLVVLLATTTGGLIDSWRVRQKIAASDPMSPMAEMGAAPGEVEHEV